VLWPAISEDAPGMSATPVSNPPREISVVEPVSLALERVRHMLFRPFDLGKWFTIGFCAWLACLGQSGGGFHYGGGNHFNSQGNNFQESFRHAFEQARNYTLANLYWLAPLVIFIALFTFAFFVLLLWLNSRGKFMFLHCVALDRAAVVEPWNKFSVPGNSLFCFRLVLGLIGFILTLPVFGIIFFLVLKMIRRGEPNVAAIVACAALFLFWMALSIAFALVQKFTMDFAVPIMFLRGKKCVAAWQEFWPMLCAHAGQFTLYILFQIVLAIAIGVILLFVVLLTCCLAGCVMMMPYIGTVLLLPVLIFQRAYSLYFLSQFGVAYDVFLPATTLPPPPI
jgi:hypothetical protein